MEIKIRPAVNSDINRIIEMLKSIAAIHHNGRPDIFKPASSKYNETELAQIIADKDRPIFAAVDENNNLIGYAFCIIQRYKDSGIFYDHISLYVDDLYVEGNIRGQGIGHKLMDYIVNFASEIGASSVELNVWEFNTSAYEFYKNYGMKTKSRKMELIL